MYLLCNHYDIKSSEKEQERSRIILRLTYQVNTLEKIRYNLTQNQVFSLLTK